MRTTRNEKQRYRTSKNARRKKILIRDCELPIEKVETVLRQLYSRPIVQLENIDKMNKKPERGTRYYSPNWYNFDNGKHRRRRWNDLDDIWKPNYDYDERDSWDTDDPNASNNNQQQYRYNCNNPYLFPYQYYPNGKQNSYIKRSTIINYNGNLKQVKRLSPHKSNISKEVTATCTSADQLNSTSNNSTVTSSTEQNLSIAYGNGSNEGSNINNNMDFTKKRFNINKKLSYLENYSKPSSGKIETTTALPETQTVVGGNIQNTNNNNLLNKSAEKSSENKIYKNGVKERPKTPSNNGKVGKKSNCTLDAYIQNILPTAFSKKGKEAVGKGNSTEKSTNSAEIVNNILKNYKIPKEKNTGANKTTASNTIGTMSYATTIANSCGTSESRNATSSPKTYSKKNRTGVVTYPNILKRPKITHDTSSIKLNNNNNVGALETFRRDITNSNVYNNQLLRNCLNLNEFKSGSRKTTIILSKSAEATKVTEATQSVNENTTGETNKVTDKEVSLEKKEDIKEPTAKIRKRRNTVAQSSVSDAASKEDTAKNRDESASKLITEKTTKSRAKIRNRRQTFAYLSEPVQVIIENTTEENKEPSAEATLNSAPEEPVNTRSKIRKRRQTIAEPIVTECDAKKADDSNDQNNSIDQCEKEDSIVSLKEKCEKRRKIELELGLTEEVSTIEVTESENPSEYDLLGSNTNKITTPIQKFDNYELHSGYKQQQFSGNECTILTNIDSNTIEIPLSAQISILDPRLKKRPNLFQQRNMSDDNEGSPIKFRRFLTAEESLHFLFDELKDASEKRSSISCQPAVPWNLKKIVGSNFVIVRQASSSIESTPLEAVSTLETETHESLVQNAEERTEESVLKTSTCVNTATAVNDQSKIYQNSLNRFFQLNTRNLRSILEECSEPTPGPNIAELVLNQPSVNNSNVPTEANHNNSNQSVNNVNQSTIQPETTSSQGAAIATQTEPKRTRSKSKGKSKTVDQGGEAQPIINPSLTQITYETFVSDFYYQIFIYCDTHLLITQKFRSFANVGVPPQVNFQELLDFDVTFYNKVRRFAELVRNYFQTRFIASFNCKYLFRCFCVINYNISGQRANLPFLLKLFYGVTVEIKKFGKLKGFLQVFCKDIENVYRCNISNTANNPKNIMTFQNQQQMNQSQLYQAQNNEQHYQNFPSQYLQNNQSYVQYQKPPPPYTASTYHQSTVVQPHSGFETQTLNQQQAFSQPPALSQPEDVSKFQAYSQPYTVSQPPHQYEQTAQQQNLDQFGQPQQKQLGTSEGNDVNKLTPDQEAMFQLQCSVYNTLIHNYQVLFVQTPLNQLGTNELQPQNNILSTSHLPNPNVLPDNDSTSDVTQPTVNYKIRLPLSQPLTATASTNNDVDVGAGDHLAKTVQLKEGLTADVEDNLNSGQDTEVPTDIDVKNVLVHEDPIDVDEWFRLKMLSEDVIDLDQFFVDDQNVVIKSENEENNDSTDSNAVDVIPRFGSVDSGLASSPNEIEHPDVLNGERLCLCSNKAELVCLCGKAIYCSTICQRADWYSHKLECGRTRGLIS